jgi:hypothetical protein
VTRSANSSPRICGMITSVTKTSIRSRMVLCNFQRFAIVLRLQHLVALRFKEFAQRPPNGRLFLRQEHRFRDCRCRTRELASFSWAHRSRLPPSPLLQLERKPDEGIGRVVARCIASRAVVVLSASVEGCVRLYCNPNSMFCIGQYANWATAPLLLGLPLVLPVTAAAGKRKASAVPVVINGPASNVYFVPKW